MLNLNKALAAVAAGLLLSPGAFAQAGWNWIQANAGPNSDSARKPQYAAANDQIIDFNGKCDMDRVSVLDVASGNWAHYNFIPNYNGCSNPGVCYPQGCNAPGVIDPWMGPVQGLFPWQNCRSDFAAASDPVLGEVMILRAWRGNWQPNEGFAGITWDGVASHNVYQSYGGTYRQLASVAWHDESTDLLHCLGDWGAGLVVHSRDRSGQWSSGAPFLVTPNVSSELWYWDANRRKLVYPSLSSPIISIWELDIDTMFWTERTVVPSSFHPRTGVAVGYHEDTGIAVFFGGRLESDNSLRNDIWHYDGQSFYQASVGVSPAKRAGAKMCYHPPSQSLIMFGGENGAVLADTWRYRPASQTVAYQSFGSGCLGTSGTPTLVATPGSLPFAGQPFTVNVQNIPFFTSCFMGMGFSTTSYNGAALPLDLTVLNMPGCTLYTSLDWGVIPTTNVLGTAVWTFQIPPGVGGATFYNQAIVFDPLANQAGLTVSNAAEATVGY